MITVAQLQIELIANTKSVDEALPRVNQQVEKTNQNVKTAGGLFSGLPGFIGGAASGLLNFAASAGMAFMGLQNLVGTLFNLGKALIEPDASMEQTDVAFTHLLGSSKAASDEIKNLKKFAADTPFEFPELANTTEELLGFQFDLSQTQPLLTAIGDALSGLGKNTPAYLEQVVNVFGQMHAGVTIQTQDLMQLTSVGINGFKLLADNLSLTKDQVDELVKKGIVPAGDAQGLLNGNIKLTVGQLKDMVTAGLIPSQQGIDALQAGMEKTFGGGMQAQSRTFNGLLSTFNDNVSQALQTVTGPIFDKLKDGLTWLGNEVQSKGFQDFAKTVGQDIAGAFDKAGQFLQTLKEKFLEAFDDKNGEKVSKLKDLAKDLGDKLKDLGDWIKDHGKKALEDLATDAGKLASWLSDLKQHIQDVKQWFDQWGPVILTVAGIITAFFLPAIIKSGLESLIASERIAQNFIESIIQTGIEALKSAASLWTDPASIFSAMGNVGEAAETNAKKVATMTAAEQAVGEKAAASEEVTALASAEQAAGEKAVVAAPELDTLAASEQGVGDSATAAAGEQGGSTGIGGFLSMLNFLAILVPPQQEQMIKLKDAFTGLAESIGTAYTALSNYNDASYRQGQGNLNIPPPTYKPVSKPGVHALGGVVGPHEMLSLINDVPGGAGELVKLSTGDTVFTHNQSVTMLQQQAQPQQVVHNDTINLYGPTSDQLMQQLSAHQARQKALVFGGRR